ncbi:MAG: hypothetical protein US30_C0004G0133 [Candidatus Moranbacteria bacterium GW2011_GWF2_36_839]|nr:MAG: hypothetical protein US27_C0002G0136 [Candidatus Moranbacteria bacterium GW2011_GWF1_36_78]KKQ17389.1 MAG: hypothetical protein US30_C0004G0133 [Candidatus Moranbacteria bacterium GW2011_GWF2_36_839]HAT73769.1 hypothetical protein [Candidatus Moranbacteria bacterium]HBY11088.1 hypothetical protein [Candidatus Moranbacteria bacterium]
MNDKKPKIHLDSFEEYSISILRYIEWMLDSYFKNTKNISIDDIKKHELEINAYENFDNLVPLKEDKIIILDDDKISTTQAEKAILDGKFLWEHAAAGEATRLGLGTKYLLSPSQFSIEEIVNHMRQEAIKEIIKKGVSGVSLIKEKKKINKEINSETVLRISHVNPGSLANISLGNRHMLQMVFDVIKLAKKNKQNPRKVLAKQTILMILNEQTAEDIIEEFKRFDFFGLNPKKVYFMIQRSFHGIYIKDGCLYYDRTTEKNKRLHNHGQMVMQKIHDSVVFRVNPKNTGKKVFISNTEFEKILAQHDDLLSYNVEDLGYLTCSIDLPSLSLALDLGKKGYGMVMEIVAQNPIKPQKGGACFFDKKLNRVVMIETNQLKDIKNENIKHLNKNFNHFPNPAKSYRLMKEKGLPISFEVKSTFNQSGDPCNYIYANTPQGNTNFLVKTAYVMRKNLKPIYNWKSPATTPVAVKAMHDQDKQVGFSEFVKNIKKGKVC